MSDEGGDAALEDRVMGALRQCLLGDRAIPQQHEKWWRNLAREAIEAARVGMMRDLRAEGWEARDKARAQYLGPADGHYPDDCMGWEDCHCASYPNPYRP